MPPVHWIDGYTAEHRYKSTGIVLQRQHCISLREMIVNLHKKGWVGIMLKKEEENKKKE